MLEKLAENSQKAVNEGVYDVDYRLTKSNKNITDEIRKNIHA